MTIRALTIAGEAAMERAGLDARAIIEAHDDEVVRSYAATGLLMVAMAEIVTGLARDNAVEALSEMLRELGATNALT